MLYDPKWETHVDQKADPFKLRSLIAWLEKQPSDVPYNYICNGECLLSQYFAAQGFQSVHMFSYAFRHADGWCHLPRNFNNVALHKPHLFRDALKRARSFIGDK